MHEIQRPAGGFVAWKMCENTHTMAAPGCAGEASMCAEAEPTPEILGPEASILGGGGGSRPPPPMKILGGKTYRFAPLII